VLGATDLELRAFWPETEMLAACLLGYQQAFADVGQEPSVPHASKANGRLIWRPAARIRDLEVGAAAANLYADEANEFTRRDPGHPTRREASRAGHSPRSRSTTTL
jgi:hypothetical protein